MRFPRSAATGVLPLCSSATSPSPARVRSGRGRARVLGLLLASLLLAFLADAGGGRSSGPAKLRGVRPGHAGAPGLCDAACLSACLPARVTLSSSESLDTTKVRSLCATIALQEYHASLTDRGLQAPNRAQNLRTFFDDDGIRIVPRETDGPARWSFGWCTRSWGREDAALRELTPRRTPEHQGARVRFDHGDLVEWYENGRDGLEQGFTIAHRPAGRGRILIRGVVSGDLLPVRRPEARGVDLVDARGVPVLRYADLRVTDAAGRLVPSTLDLAGCEITLSADDSRAEYPLTIDPLISTPSWTAEGDQPGAALGTSVATAGDVNGDGYSDVIVGAPQYDAGEEDEGRAFLYLGSSAGLVPASSWTAEGDQSGAHFGASVGCAGDVNSDGYADVFVGAPQFTSTEVGEGSVHVYYGSEAGPAQAADWTANGGQAAAAFGSSAAAGDVNGDGFADLIIGEPLFDGSAVDEGRTRVFLGSADGLASDACWSAEGDQDSAGFGTAVSAAGDVNADGKADVLVGAPGHDGSSADEGKAYVFHGTAAGVSSAPSWTAGGDQAGAAFGAAAGSAGDVNGDGYADVVVGAPLFDHVLSDVGKVWLYNGSPAGLGSASSWSAEGVQAGCAFGSSVALAGDVNSDGYADVLVGAPAYDNGQTDEGKAFLYTGGPAGLSATAGWSAEGNQAGARFGAALASAGDVNGDGFSDAAVGAPAYDAGQADEGRGFLFHGAPEGLPVTPQWSYVADELGAFFGQAAGTAGDVNGDGYSDVIIGADGFDNGGWERGRAYLFLGSADGLLQDPAWILEGQVTRAYLGVSAGTAGDVNGDGYADVLVGAYRLTADQEEEGRAYLFLGSPAGLGAEPDWTVDGNQPLAWLGWSVATAGDVNADGYSDVLIGVPCYNGGLHDQGRVDLYLGSPNGLSSTPDWSVPGGRAEANFSVSMGTAGDVNGDGCSDIIVGAYGWNAGFFEQGMACVFLGSRESMSTTPVWIVTGTQEIEYYGISSGTAGDVNGDGYSDIIVGAYQHTNGNYCEGRAYVYNGGPNGVSPTPSWSTEGNQNIARYGYAVATAGDMNADGYSDVLVGAQMFDNGETDEGKAFLYYGGPSGLSTVPAWTVEGNQVEAYYGSTLNLAGDVNGDGFSDILVGSGYVDDGGGVSCYYGNAGRGVTRLPRQVRTSGTLSIGPLNNSDSDDGFGLKALGRSPLGRERVRLEYEVQPLGTPFDGSGIVNGPWVDTGVPGPGGSVARLFALTQGLSPETSYRWRLRVAAASPAVPHTRWYTLPYNGVTESDLKTAKLQVSVPENVAEPGGGPLLRCRPNPFVSSLELSLQLPRGGPVRVEVFDPAGRTVRVLAEGTQTAGPRVLSWDGTAADGRRLPAGVYFIRARCEGRETVRSVVLAR